MVRSKNILAQKNKISYKKIQKKCIPSYSRIPFSFYTLYTFSSYVCVEIDDAMYTCPGVELPKISVFFIRILTLFIYST